MVVVGDCVMAVSKNFLAVVSLTLLVGCLLAYNPLAPRYTDSAAGSLTGRASAVQNYN